MTIPAVVSTPVVDIWHKALAVILIVALGVGGLAAYYAVKNHEEAAVAAAENRMLAQQQLALADQEQALEQKTAAQLAAQSAAFATQMKTALGQQQFLQQQVSKIPNLPSQIVVAPPTTAGGATTVAIPANDLAAVDAAIQEYQTDKVALPACITELTNEKQQLVLSQAELANLKKVGHPSAWSKVKTAAKWTAVGIGVGALLVAAHGK
jgi:hypothetical protein